VRAKHSGVSEVNGLIHSALWLLSAISGKVEVRVKLWRPLRAWQDPLVPRWQVIREQTLAGATTHEVVAENASREQAEQIAAYFREMRRGGVYRVRRARTASRGSR